MWTFDTAERQRLLRYLASTARDPDHAEDLLQTAFLRLVEYRREHTIENEAGFLVRAAVNIAIDDARRAGIRSEVGVPVDDFHYLADTRPLQDQALLARERLERIRRAFSQLPQRTQEIFLMHREAGLKYREIAARLGISPSAVEKHIAKTTLYLADWLDNERDEVDGASPGAGPN